MHSIKEDQFMQNFMSEYNGHFVIVNMRSVIYLLMSLSNGVFVVRTLNLFTIVVS